MAASSRSPTARVTSRRSRATAAHGASSRAASRPTPIRPGVLHSQRTLIVSPSSTARRSTNSISSSSIGVVERRAARSSSSISRHARLGARGVIERAAARQRSKLSVVATVGRQKHSRKRSSVCSAPKKWPPWPTSACAPKARLASSTSTRRELRQQEVEQLASATNFSNDVTRPPSSQPADCQHDVGAGQERATAAC